MAYHLLLPIISEMIPVNRNHEEGMRILAMLASAVERKMSEETGEAQGYRLWGSQLLSAMRALGESGQEIAKVEDGFRELEELQNNEIALLRSLKARVSDLRTKHSRPLESYK